MAEPIVRDPLAVATTETEPTPEVRMPFGQMSQPAPGVPAPAPIPPEALQPSPPGPLEVTIRPPEAPVTEADLEGDDDPTPSIEDYLAGVQTEPSTLEEAIGVVQGTASGISRGVTTVLGIPVDLTNFSLRQLDFETQLPGGSDDLRELMETGPSIVSDPEAQERIRLGTGMQFFENTFEVVGAAAPLVRPTAALARTLGGERTRVTRFLRDIGAAERAEPTATFRRELATAAGAGATGATVLAISPEDTTGRLIGEIVGGVGTGFGIAAGPKLMKVMPTGIILRAVRRLRGKDAEARAASVVQELASRGEGGVAGAVRGIEEARGLGMSPAAAAGNPELMALERSVIAAYRELGPKFKEQAEQVTRALAREITEVAGAPPSGLNTAAEVLTERHRYLIGLMEERITVSMAKAKERIDALGEGVTLSVANKTVRDEIEKSFRAVQLQERQIWRGIDMKAKTETTRTQATMEDILRSLEAPERISDFISPRLQIWLGRRDKVGAVRKFLVGKLTKKPTIGNLDAVRKLIGQNIRAELGGIAPNNRKVQFLTRLDEALLDDAAIGAGDTLSAAVTFSRDVSARFRKGTVGEIRGIRNAAGTVMIDPSLTVDQTISRFGGPGRLSAEQILEAVKNAPDTTRVMIQRVLREAFATRFARLQPDGTLGVSEKSAEAFLRENRELFNLFPKLREEFKDIPAIQATLKREVERKAYLMTNDQARKRAKAGMLLGEAQAGNIANILRSPNPGALAAQMVRQLRKSDRSGEALAGLGAEYIHGMMARSSSGLPGAKRLNGKALAGLIEQEEGVLRQIFQHNPGALNRLKRVVGQLRNQEAAVSERAITGGLEGALGTDALASIVGRVLGARVGAQVGGASGGGSIQTASIFSKLFGRWVSKLGLNKVQELLVEAVQDPELMRTLLIRPTSKVGEAKILRGLKTWATGAGVRFDSEGFPIEEHPAEEVRARPPAVITEEDIQ